MQAQNDMNPVERIRQETQVNTYAKTNSKGKGDGHGGLVIAGFSATLLIGLIVVLLVGAGVVGYLFYQEKQKPDNSVELADYEVQQMKEKIGKLILLPSDQEPTVATIVDIEKLKETNPTFYKNASNGDKILVYSDKAILYDPDNNIILDVAPIVTDPASQSASLSVELRDASDAKDLDQISAEIANYGSQFVVATKSESADASDNGVEIFIVTTDETKMQMASALATSMGAQIVESMPQGEQAPADGVDVVIVYGD
ncbi:MAG TPA: hypothetical protein PLX79_00120 [Candidatus Dojkabacteria bacterium]|nr:hypothetical protein [Candidatus Dojkabacteria bacterium]